MTASTTSVVDLAGMIDISMPIHSGMMTWENRFAPEVEWHSQFRNGEVTANSTWRLNTHTGTHVDAPLHHLVGGDAVQELSLESFIGPCQVVEISTAEGEHISAADLSELSLRPGDRVLFKTRNTKVESSVGAREFDGGFCALARDAAELLVAAGVGLVGIDCLSIEPYRSGPDFPVHHTLLSAGIGVVEGLDLSRVQPGSYLLLCLPLLLAEAEAAPGRAVLMPLQPEGSMTRELT